MSAPLKFIDQSTEESRAHWLSRELKDAAHTYRIPGYNVPYPDSHLTFKRLPKYCVDIGVNVGAFSIYASPFFKNVIGFEAAHNTYQVGLENIKASGKENINIHNLAVGTDSGETVYLCSHQGELSRDTSCFNPAENPEWTRDETEAVSTISLEDIYVEYNIDYIDYLKVDCEGSEYPFLVNKDLSKINFLTLEIHPGLIGEDLTAELLEHLSLFFNLRCKFGEHILFYEGIN
jgi:FkbM family methyltransferase